MAMQVNYPTAGGKTVTWVSCATERNPSSPSAWGDWDCSGCHSSSYSRRDGASQHAQACRAS